MLLIIFILLCALPSEIKPSYAEYKRQQQARATQERAATYMQQQLGSRYSNAMPWDPNAGAAQELIKNLSNGFYYNYNSCDATSDAKHKTQPTSSTAHLNYINHTLNHTYNPSTTSNRMPYVLQDFQYKLEQNIRNTEANERYGSQSTYTPSRYVDYTPQQRPEKTDAERKKEVEEQQRQQEEARRYRAELEASNRGDRPMKQAILSGELEKMRLLIKVGRESGLPVDCNSIIHRKSLLQWAAHAGHTEIVRELIANKADVNQRAFNTKSCLAMACRDARPEIVRVLLNAGAHYYVDYFHKTPLREIVKNITPATKDAHLACLDHLTALASEHPRFLFPALPQWRVDHENPCDKSLCTFHHVAGRSTHGTMTAEQEEIAKKLKAVIKS